MQDSVLHMVKCVLSVLAFAVCVSCIGEPGIARVPLTTQYVPMKKGNRTVSHKAVYSGVIHVGEQMFTVVFDTGSGHVIVPDESCSNTPCHKRRRYVHTASTVEVNADGNPLSSNAERQQVRLSFGVGDITGDFVRERVCIGSQPSHCIDLGVVVAQQMSEHPFESFSFDGIFGLGLDSLALNPLFGFTAQSLAQFPSLEPHFAVFIAQSDSAESMISFGGHDSSRAATSMQWASVVMAELGYWQVRIVAIRIGDEVLPFCGDGHCYAIMDTGTASVGVPRRALPAFHKALTRRVPLEPNLNCRAVPGPPIHFDLEHLTITLTMEDISRPAPYLQTSDGTTLAACRASLFSLEVNASLPSKTFLWGEPVLRRYYTVYDFAEKRVGFSIAKHDSLVKV